jgi:DeoR/GlpR family transcriptional regulator of sugar metabolism
MEVEHVSTVITDNGIEDEFRTRLEKSGITVVVAEGD